MGTQGEVLNKSSVFLIMLIFIIMSFFSCSKKRTSRYKKIIPTFRADNNAVLNSYLVSAKKLNVVCAQQCSN